MALVNRNILLVLIFAGVLLFVPTLAHAAWYDSGYDYCRELTMTAGGNSNGVATTSTKGFALVATSTMTELRTVGNGGRIQNTGSVSGTTTPTDVIITNGTECNSDGGSTVLDFYFEKYVATTGEFVLWVEPMDISSTTAKTVLMYYGNSGASDLEDEAGVFGALGEAAVWNLHEDPSCSGACVLDSTSNNNDGDSLDNMTTSQQVGGIVDGAFDMDAGDDYVEFPNSTSLNITGRLTLSVWFKPNNVTGGAYKDLITKSNDSSHDQYDMHLNGDEFGMGFYEAVGCGTTGWNSYETSATNLGAGIWYHLLLTYDDAANTIRLYKNGVFQSSVTDTDASNNSVQSCTGEPVRIGETITGEEADGVIDDVRIYADALHSMDTLTIYNNTRSSALFWTFGAEETESAPASTRVMRLLGNIRLGGVRLLGL